MSEPTTQDRPPVTMLVSPVNLNFDYTPGRAMSSSLVGFAERKVFGQRSPETGKVYVPPRGADPETGAPTSELVEVSDKGIITSYCIVNVPFMGQAVECPYVCALVLLDGADIPFQHLIQEIDAAEVRMGMRIEAVWADEPEMSFESIKYFRPTGEPDAPVEAWERYV